MDLHWFKNCAGLKHICTSRYILLHEHYAWNSFECVENYVDSFTVLKIHDS